MNTTYRIMSYDGITGSFVGGPDGKHIEGMIEANTREGGMAAYDALRAAGFDVAIMKVTTTTSGHVERVA